MGAPMAAVACLEKQDRVGRIVGLELSDSSALKAVRRLI